MSHTCHAHGCNVVVPAKMFACKRHWYALSEEMRAAIWREYRNGQEIDKKPSLRYLAVQRLAVAQLAFKPNDEEAARTAAYYAVYAWQYRARAIEAGLGDPLEGLVSS